VGKTQNIVMITRLIAVNMIIQGYVIIIKSLRNIRYKHEVHGLHCLGDGGLLGGIIIVVVVVVGFDIIELVNIVDATEALPVESPGVVDCHSESDDGEVSVVSTAAGVSVEENIRSSTSSVIIVDGFSSSYMMNYFI